MDLQRQITAMELEYGAQREILGTRAVALAAKNAQLQADKEQLAKEIEVLRARIAELEKPSTAR
jgi:cell division protein FtsB